MSKYSHIYVIYMNPFIFVEIWFFEVFFTSKINWQINFWYHFSKVWRNFLQHICNEEIIEKYRFFNGRKCLHLPFSLKTILRHINSQLVGTCGKDGGTGKHILPPRTTVAKSSTKLQDNYHQNCQKIELYVQGIKEPRN